MIKKSLYVLVLTVCTYIAAGVVPVKADMITATNQIPTLKALYHVNDAEANLQSKMNRLNSLLAKGADACDVITAQAEVNEATVVLNNLNALVANETMKTAALPAPGVCSLSCTSNALAAQAAWYDYINKAKATQASLSSTYADQILASNMNALIAQAAYAHRFSAGSTNPVSMQATANWAAMNAITSDQNAYAMAIMANPFKRY